MRNLKRVLSLSLAAIMMLGMMVIGSSAASDYSDVDYSADNVEAIEVLQAINVMTGDLDSNGNLAGTFRPGEEVSRAEMARIMAALMDLDYEYYIGVNPFTDMVGHWAEGYAAACYANGIIAGRTNTTYDPSATVTAVEAAAMLMRALGYFQNPAVDYPNGFEVSTISQAGKINLFNKVNVKTNEPMTRNDVAQLVLNALQSGMVEPATNSKIDVVVGDAQVSIGSSNYVYTVARDPAVGQAINRTKAEGGNSSTGLEGDILDLGEKLYNGELKLKDTTDVFQRPARTWEFKGAEVGTYVKDELLVQTWTEKVTGRMLYDLLTKSTIEYYGYSIAVDGETEQSVLGSAFFSPDNLIHSNTEGVGATDNGVITEVYVDNVKNIYYIAVINTYLAKASGDYNTKQETAKFAVWSLDKKTVSGGSVLVKNTSNEGSTILDVSVDDFDVSGIEDGDICLVQVAEGEIQVFIEPEVIDETKISSFKKGDWVVADGEKYTYNKAISYDEEVLDYYDNLNMKDTSYRLYLDPNGYVLGVEILEEANQYVFLTGLDTNGSNITNKTATGKVIFLDGTVDTVEINMEKSAAADGSKLPDKALLNTWCTYSVNSSGVYTLVEVANDDLTFGKDDLNGNKWNSKEGHDRLGQSQTVPAGALKISKRNIDLDGITGTDYKTVYGNDDTVYLTAELDKLTGTDTLTVAVIDDVESVVTGVQNANITVWTQADIDSPTFESGKYANLAGYSEGVYTLFNDKGYIIAAVVVGEDDGASSHYAFVHTDDVKQEDWTISDTTRSEDGIYTWYRDVILDGEETTLVENNDSNPELKKLVQGEWWEIKFKADGTVRKVEKINFDGSDVRYIRDIEKLEDSVDARDTVLLFYNATNKIVRYSGATLHVDTTVTKTAYGFPVASDAKIVLLTAKAVNGVVSSTNWWNYVSSYTGPSGLEQAVNQLNKEDDSELFKGYISAVFENGVAKVVVINDQIPTNTVTGSGGVGGDNYVSREDENGNVDTTGVVYYYHVAYGNDIDDVTIDEVLAAMIAELGWTWDASRGDRITGNNDGYTILYNGVYYTVKLVEDPDEDNEEKGLGADIASGVEEAVAALPGKDGGTPELEDPVVDEEGRTVTFKVTGLEPGTHVKFTWETTEGTEGLLIYAKSVTVSASVGTAVVVAGEDGVAELIVIADSATVFVELTAVEAAEEFGLTIVNEYEETVVVTTDKETAYGGEQVTLNVALAGEIGEYETITVSFDGVDAEDVIFTYEDAEATTVTFTMPDEATTVTVTVTVEDNTPQEEGTVRVTADFGEVTTATTEPEYVDIKLGETGTLTVVLGNEKDTVDDVTGVAGVVEAVLEDDGVTITITVAEDCAVTEATVVVTITEYEEPSQEEGTVRVYVDFGEVTTASIEEFDGNNFIDIELGGTDTLTVVLGDAKDTIDDVTVEAEGVEASFEGSVITITVAEDCAVTEATVVVTITEYEAPQLEGFDARYPATYNEETKTITVPYYGDVPESEDVVIKINDEKSEAKDLGVAYVIGEKVYDSSVKEITGVTVELVKYVKVSVYGETSPLGYVPATEGGAVSVGELTDPLFVILDDEEDVTSGTEVTITEEEFEIDPSDEDVVLYPAVSVDGGGEIDITGDQIKIYNPDDENWITLDTAETLVALKDGVRIRVICSEETGLWALTVNGEVEKGPYLNPTSGTEAEFSNIGALADEDGKIVIDQVQGLKIVILDTDGEAAETLDFELLDAGGEVSLELDQKYAPLGAADPVYVAIQDDAAWAEAGAGATVVKLTRDSTEETDGSFTTKAVGTIGTDVVAFADDGTGVLTLAPAALVKVAGNNLDTAISKVEAAYGEIEATELDTWTDGYYVAVGTTLSLTSIDTDTTEGQYIGVKVGETDVVQVPGSEAVGEANGSATAEYTIDSTEDLVFSLEEAPEPEEGP